MTLIHKVLSVFTLLGIAAVALPFMSFAQTYHYVSTSGEVKAVEADSAAEALAKPSDIASHSGVAIDRGLIESGMEIETIGGTGGANEFAYVNTTGEVEAIIAPNPQAAIAGASDIHPESGVAIVIDGSILAVDEVESAE